MSSSLNISRLIKGEMEQQFYTSDHEVQDYMAYDPVLSAMISPEDTTASLGAAGQE